MTADSPYQYREGFEMKIEPPTVTLQIIHKRKRLGDFKPVDGFTRVSGSEGHLDSGGKS